MTENDFRFDWLQNTLLPYFNNRKHKILQRPGNFTASAREKMFISRQTHEGIQITCYSVIETSKYFFLNWDLLHARLNSHYKALTYKKGRTKKITGYRKSV